MKEEPVETTAALHQAIRKALRDLRLSDTDEKASVRRTFQALRIAVNDEFATLDWLLRSLPDYLAPGGRVAILTFHSGEDRRVKKAFQSGHRAGTYSAINTEVIRAGADETRANPRASSASCAGRSVIQPAGPERAALKVGRRRCARIALGDYNLPQRERGDVLRQPG